MISNEARLHLVMLLSSYSHHVANVFEKEFEHRERVRSSDKVEIKEINDWWRTELKKSSLNDSLLVDQLSCEDGIKEWLDDFERILIPVILRHFKIPKSRSKRR